MKGAYTYDTQIFHEELLKQLEERTVMVILSYLGNLTICAVLILISIQQASQ